jgi:hypothetical protein
MGYIAKAVTALVAGLIGWATEVVNSPPPDITAPEWIALATVVAVAFGVYVVPNQRRATAP